MVPDSMLSPPQSQESTSLLSAARANLRDFITDGRASSRVTEHKQWLRYQFMALGVVIIMFVMLVCLAILRPVVMMGHSDELVQCHVCRTTDCEEHSAILNRLFKHLDPCNDFEQFVCSALQPDSHFIGLSWDTQTNMTFRYYNRLIRMLQTRNQRTTSGLRKAATALQSCLAQAMIMNNDIETLKRFFAGRRIPIFSSEERGTYETENVHPLDVLIDLSVNYNLAFWFELDLLPVSAGNPKHLLMTHIDQVTYITYFRKMYVFTEYKDYLNKFLKLINATLSEEMLERLTTTERVALEMVSEMHKKPVNEGVVRFRDIEIFTPNISRDLWLSLLNKHYYPYQYFDNEDELIFSNIHFPRSLNTVLSVLRSRDVIELIGFWAMKIYAWLGNPDILQLALGSHDTVKDYIPTLCLIDVEDIFESVLFAKYIDLRFPPEEKRKVDSLLSNIVLRAKSMFDKSHWIDRDSARYAKQKLNNITFNLWPTADLLGRNARAYDNFSDFQGPYLKAWEKSRSAIKTLMESIPYNDHSRHGISARVLHLSYLYHTNMVDISPAALSAPLYYKDGTMGMAYGGFGVHVAAQIAKAFDEQGLVANTNHQLGSWWSEATRSTYNSKVSCIGSETASLFPFIPALEIAYEEYRGFLKHQLKSQTGFRLEFAEGFSGDRVFFITFCLYLCHSSPSQKRASICNDVLRKFTPFAKTFNCSCGSHMNPCESCSFFY
ncbi:neprilysin-2-like [Ornithodoros turicata]|uniref:neprilysin-2-like n=1 Tax=Ornithodoros turicata TaxID=34597 RepID=UPI003139D130